MLARELTGMFWSGARIPRYGGAVGREITQPEIRNEMEGGMPVSVVVGGEFGSEVIGKVALEIVRRDPAVAAAIRVGATNSGHTAIATDGKTYALRQLPAASVDRSIIVILPPGSYIDIDIFRDEIERLGF